MKRTALTVLLILNTAIVVAGEAAGDAAAGKAKSAPCAGCHGADGNSTNPEWPKLAGQNPQYLMKQLADFKEGKTRNNAMMAPMVAGLSPQDMADIAAYYASQSRTGGYADPKKVFLGEKIYRGGNLESGVAACAGCHSPNGAGNPSAVFPAVSGQHAAYIATQLSNFRSGQRANDPKRMMRDVATKLTPQEILGVAQYMQGLY